MRKVLLVVGGVALMAGSLQVPVTANAAEEACEWVGTVEVANTSSFPTMYGNADTRTIQTVTATRRRRHRRNRRRDRRRRQRQRRARTCLPRAKETTTNGGFPAAR